ncbi:MAG: cobalamin biosynthesis protein CbiG, partial [Oscillospiraceae bacterium]|nr:cobalamin biosynthesis protein CbiG [Oscillospiraceae bacterium]
MKIAAIAFSERGAELGATLELPTTRCPDGGLADWTALHFNACDALVFIGSCGIAVRAIAPHVHCKASDPAVVVVDELGTFAIALLSGHLGGANALTATLATKLNAMPVVTTATDIAGVAAVDVWAQRNGFAIANLERVKRVSARLLNTGGADAYISFHASDAQTDGLRLIPRIVTLGIGCRRGVTLSAIESAVAQT